MYTFTINNKAVEQSEAITAIDADGYNRKEHIDSMKSIIVNTYMTVQTHTTKDREVVAVVWS